MTDESLTHNPLNGVTAGVWKRGSIVHKVLTRRREVPPNGRRLSTLGIGTTGGERRWPMRPGFLSAWG